MKENKLAELSMEFAVDIINLVRQLKENREAIISNQIGRSGTSIGANIHEAQYAQGKKDFISKLEIALKEASETGYTSVAFFNSSASHIMSASVTLYLFATDLTALIYVCMSNGRIYVFSLMKSLKASYICLWFFFKPSSPRFVVRSSKVGSYASSISLLSRFVGFLSDVSEKFPSECLTFGTVCGILLLIPVVGSDVP